MANISIATTGVALNENWGVTFNDYSIKTKTDGANGAVNTTTVSADFQDLMVSVSEHRAVTVEDEVTPMAQRMRDRNKFLDELGTALADLTKQQASYKSDAEGDDTTDTGISNASIKIIKKATGETPSSKMTKKNNEYFIQRIKSAIDGLNNAAQTDMTRLQSLVDRRDESYSTATNLMTEISDTRGNLIRNLA